MESEHNGTALAIEPELESLATFSVQDVHFDQNGPIGRLRRSCCRCGKSTDCVSEHASISLGPNDTTIHGALCRPCFECALAKPAEFFAGFTQSAPSTEPVDAKPKVGQSLTEDQLRAMTAPATPDDPDNYNGMCWACRTIHTGRPYGPMCVAPKPAANAELWCIGCNKNHTAPFCPRV